MLKQSVDRLDMSYVSKETVTWHFTKFPPIYIRELIHVYNLTKLELVDDRIYPEFHLGCTPVVGIWEMGKKDRNKNLWINHIIRLISLFVDKTSGWMDGSMGPN